MKAFFNTLTWYIGWPLRLLGLSANVAQIVAYALLILGTIVIAGLVYQACSGLFKRKATIDLDTVTKINNADRKERLEELEKTVIQNQDVIESASNRTALTDLDIEARDREIKAKVLEADKKIMEAKEQGRDVTSAELECILTGNCE